jgi:hypothetical protein
MLEKDIEKKVTKYAQSLGWIPYKFVSPEKRGVPDRIFIRDGKIIFVEFKRKGNPLTSLQKHEWKILSDNKMEVYLIDNCSDGKGLFDDIQNNI